jgi:hypothetical protein
LTAIECGVETHVSSLTSTFYDSLQPEKFSVVPIMILGAFRVWRCCRDRIRVSMLSCDLSPRICTTSLQESSGFAHEFVNGASQLWQVLLDDRPDDVDIDAEVGVTWRSRALLGTGQASAHGRTHLASSFVARYRILKIEPSR